MVFDPTKPAYRSQSTSAELRDNFSALAQHHRGASAPGAGVPGLGWIWLDTADATNWKLKVYSRLGDATPSWKTLFEHVEATPFAGSDVEQTQVLYVGKHGVDTNNGKTLGRAKLTFGSAIAAAGAPANEPAAVTISCPDNGEYNEYITLPSFVNIHAPRATIKGKLTIAGSSRITLSRLLNDVGTTSVIIDKQSGSASDEVFLDVGEIVNDTIEPSTTDLAVIAYGSFYLRAHRLVQTEGDGILFLSGGAGDVALYLDVGEWDVGTANAGGNPTGLMTGQVPGAYGTARTYGRIGSMIGGAASKCIEVDTIGGGEVYLSVGVLTSPLYAYSASDGTLRLIVGELSGSEVISDGVDVRVTKARRDGTKAGVPGVNEDEGDGYQMFSMIYDSNAGDMYVCCDPSAGAATWKKTTP